MNLKHLDSTFPEELPKISFPAEDVNEASSTDGIKVIPSVSLTQLVSHLRGEISIPPRKPDKDWRCGNFDSPHIDLAHIKGQEHAKRVLEVAAAGGHNILLS